MNLFEKNCSVMGWCWFESSLAESLEAAFATLCENRTQDESGSACWCTSLWAFGSLNHSARNLCSVLPAVALVTGDLPRDSDARSRIYR